MCVCVCVFVCVCMCVFRQVKACKRENLYKLKVNDIHCRFGAGRVVNHVTGNSPEQKFIALRRWCGFFLLVSRVILDSYLAS